MFRYLFAWRRVFFPCFSFTILWKCLGNNQFRFPLAGDSRVPAEASLGHAMLQKAWHRKAFDDLAKQVTPNRSAIPLASLSTPTALSPMLPKILRNIGDNTTLFYHVHIPKTGGTTAAHLLVSDICAPYNDLISLQGWDSQCNVTCEMGLTDNEFSCYPNRNEFEHNAYVLNMRRAEDLKANLGAKEVVYVTTLRRGSDRLVSQWKAEVGYGTFVPPDGVPPLSMQSLQIYLTNGPHTGYGWIAPWNPALRNNLQVGQLASRLILTDMEPLTEADLDEAKRVLMSGHWLIGFSECMEQFQEKLLEYTAHLHGGYKEKEIPLDTHSDSEVVVDEMTKQLLEESTALDNALYDWAWTLAESSADPRFTKTC